MTPTQRKVLEALSPEEWLTPADVAKTATDGNCGGAAASLRVLMRHKLVAQRVKGRKGRWTLYEYRRVAYPPVADGQMVHAGAIR